jgi:hypothetical protein
LRSPTSGSPARKVIELPPWLRRLLIPPFVRRAARELGDRNPDLSPAQIAAHVRARVLEELRRPPQPDEARIIEATLARLPAPQRKRVENPASAWLLVAANLVPLAGVLAWDWNAFALIALFWMENAVLGAIFALRMLCADPDDVAQWIGKLFAVPFFCFHYGMFTAIHGVLVFSLLGGGAYAARGLDVLEPALRAAADYRLWLPLAVLAASHLFSFAWNYLYRGEFRRARLRELMTRPYGRVVVLHFTILLGGVAALALGSPLWALIVLVALKIALDFRAHVKEHSAA